MRRIIVMMLVFVLLCSVGAFAQKKGRTKLVGDKNGNKIFEDLEEKLAEIKGNYELDIIVVFNENFTKKAIEAKIGAFDLKYNYKNINAFAGKLNKGQINALSHMPMVKHVQLDGKVKAYNDDATYWYGADKVSSDFGYDGDRDGNLGVYSKDDVVVAVIDTGIDANHVDLDEGKVLYFKDWTRKNRTEPYDDNGHGTHCAGTIAGTGEGNTAYKGVAPGAALIGLKVLDARGSGSMSDIDAAIEWCINNKDTYGIDVLSMSLGAAGSSDGTDSTSMLVNQAADAGLVSVIAAGNEGPSNYTIGTPGAAEKAITVGAMADVGEGGYYQAYFSSRGPTADGRVKPDISAPGYYVMSVEANTTSGYTEMSGTSMATPYTAGTVALMLDSNPALTPTEIKSKIMNTSVDFGVAGKDIDYGAGRLDTYEAVKSAGSLYGVGVTQPSHYVDENYLSGSGDYIEYNINVDTLDYPIAVNLIMLDDYTDYDLYLYDPSGNQVAKSIDTKRQEDLSYFPTVTGQYVLRAYSYSGNGDYSLDISY